MSTTASRAIAAHMTGANGAKRKAGAAATSATEAEKNAIDGMGLFS
jgi:hypothetical protein